MSWTESNDNLLLSACGDGSVLLWDIKEGKLVLEMREHKAEVQSIECNYKNTNVFLSAGSDGAVKLWDLQHGKMVMNFPAHKGVCY